MIRQKCSALVGSECKNGFSVTGACHGINAETVLPMCCKEELCGRLFNHNSGKPTPLDERYTVKAVHGIGEKKRSSGSLIS